MLARVLECPRCGAPLPRRAALVRVVCEFCKNDVVFERVSVRAREYREALAGYAKGDPHDVVLGGFGLKLAGRIAVGHSSVVYLATRVTRLSERVVLKVLRQPDDSALLDNELSVLGALASSNVRGAAHFSSLVPQLAFAGKLSGKDWGAQRAAAFREPVGFTHTLAQLRARFPAGLDARHAVWLWRRTLELLAFLHENGVAHGAILPEHVLVNPREHSTRLLGFACAGKLGAPLVALDPTRADFYRAEHRLGAAADLCMLARCMLFCVGGDARGVPADVPRELAELLQREAHGSSAAHDPAHLSREISDVARHCFGPPKFVPLELA